MSSFGLLEALPGELTVAATANADVGRVVGAVAGADEETLEVGAAYFNWVCDCPG